MTPAQVGDALAQYLPTSQCKLVIGLLTTLLGSLWIASVTQVFPPSELALQALARTPPAMLINLLLTLALVSIAAIWLLILLIRYKNPVHLQRQITLIDNWRQLVTDINKSKSEKTYFQLVGLHPHYPSLKPYLSHKTLKELARQTTWIVGSPLPAPLLYISEDIDNVRKKWGLP